MTNGRRRILFEICQKHSIPEDNYLDFAMLMDHNNVTDPQFDIRLREAKNYKECLRELCGSFFGTALSYLDGFNDY